MRQKIMRGSCSAVALLLCVLAPAAAHAQVVVSEFMYDAPGNDDKQEWVEAFNAGAASVDLSKWKVNDGSNHVLNAPPKNGGTGSLMLASGAYLILADDAATFLAGHPSPACSVIDTALSLPNASGTVSLIDDTGAVADSFAYTKDMGAAGDGNTLQRQSVSGVSFIAAAPTPCAGPLVAPAAAGAGSSNDASSSTQQASNPGTAPSAQQAPVSSYVAPPLPTLFADGGADRTAIVGADAVFSGRAYLRSKDIVNNVRYSWNFGDGTTAEGESVIHHWEYPGRFAVMLTVAQDKNMGVDQIIVTAEPARLSFNVFGDGSVEIGDRAERDLDLSGWIVKNETRSFMLPEGSVILSGSAMRIAQKTLGFWSGSSTELEYPNGMPALHAGQESAGAPAFAPPPLVPLPAAPQATTSAPSLMPQAFPAAHARKKTPPGSVPQKETADAAQRDSADNTDNATSSDFAAADTPRPSQSASAAFPVRSPWLWGAFALATLGAAAGFLARAAKKNEWDIEEMPG